MPFDSAGSDPASTLRPELGDFSAQMEACRRARPVEIPSVGRARTVERNETP